MTRWEIEAALDQGRVEAHMPNGNWWRVRRNGQTKTWKTRPGEFRIPVKDGLGLSRRPCGYIDHTNMNDANLFRVLPKEG